MSHPDKQTATPRQTWRYVPSGPGYCAHIEIPPHRHIPDQWRIILINPSPAENSESDELARLIAAAPELLDAAKRALLFIDTLCASSTLRADKVIKMPSYQHIRAAIAKAEGCTCGADRTGPTAEAHAPDCAEGHA